MKSLSKLILATALVSSTASVANAGINIYDPSGPVATILIYVVGPIGALACTVAAELPQNLLDCGLTYQNMGKAVADIKIMRKTGVESKRLVRYIQDYKGDLKSNPLVTVRPSVQEIDALTDLQVADQIEYSYLVANFFKRGTIRSYFLPALDAKLVGYLYPSGYVKEDTRAVLNRIQFNRVQGASYMTVEDMKHTSYNPDPYWANMTVIDADGTVHPPEKYD